MEDNKKLFEELPEFGSLYDNSDELPELTEEENGFFDSVVADLQKVIDYKISPVWIKHKLVVEFMEEAVETRLLQKEEYKALSEEDKKWVLSQVLDKCTLSIPNVIDFNYDNVMVNDFDLYRVRKHLDK